MKKILSILLIFVVLSGFVFSESTEEENTENSNNNENIENAENAKNAEETETEVPSSEKFPDRYAVLDMDNSRLLMSSGAGDKIDIGGMVHIMEALILLENHNLEETVTAGENFQMPDGVSIAIDNGEQFKLKDLLNALLLISANDAALVLAEYNSQTLDSFVDSMNEKARKLGLTGTNYSTVIDILKENHYTTVADIAFLSNEAMKHEAFREIVKAINYNIEPTNKKTEARNYIGQKNGFILNDGSTMSYANETVPIYDEKVTGIKVDFWSRGTYTIVTSFEYGGMNIIAVSNGEGDQSTAYAKHKSIMDTFIKNFKKKTLINKGETVETIKVEGADKEGLNLVASETVYAILPITEDKSDSIKRNVTKLDSEQIVIDAGVKLGELSFTLDGVEISKVDLVAEHSVDGGAFVGGVVETKEEKTPLQVFLGIFIFVFQVILVLLIWGYVVRKRRYRIRKSKLKKEESNVTRIDDYRWR